MNPNTPLQHPQDDDDDGDDELKTQGIDVQNVSSGVATADADASSEINEEIGKEVAERNPQRSFPSFLPLPGSSSFEVCYADSNMPTIQPIQIADRSGRADILYPGTPDAEVFQSMTKDLETIRSFQREVLQPNPEIISAFDAGGIPPELFTTTKNFVSKMDPEELQKMLEFASVFGAKSPQVALTPLSEADPVEPFLVNEKEVSTEKDVSQSRGNPDPFESNSGEACPSKLEELQGNICLVVNDRAMRQEDESTNNVGKIVSIESGMPLVMEAVETEKLAGLVHSLNEFDSRKQVAERVWKREEDDGQGRTSWLLGMPSLALAVCVLVVASLVHLVAGLIPG